MSSERDNCQLLHNEFWISNILKNSKAGTMPTHQSRKIVKQKRYTTRQSVTQRERRDIYKNNQMSSPQRIRRITRDSDSVPATVGKKNGSHPKNNVTLITPASQTTTITNSASDNETSLTNNGKAVEATEGKVSSNLDAQLQEESNALESKPAEAPTDDHPTEIGQPTETSHQEESKALDSKPAEAPTDDHPTENGQSTETGHQDLSKAGTNVETPASNTGQDTAPRPDSQEEDANNNSPPSSPNESDTSQDNNQDHKDGNTSNDEQDTDNTNDSKGLPKDSKTDAVQTTLSSFGFNQGSNCSTEEKVKHENKTENKRDKVPKYRVEYHPASMFETLTEPNDQDLIDSVHASAPEPEDKDTVTFKINMIKNDPDTSNVASTNMNVDTEESQLEGLEESSLDSSPLYCLALSNDSNQKSASNETYVQQEKKKQKPGRNRSSSRRARQRGSKSPLQRASSKVSFRVSPTEEDDIDTVGSNETTFNVPRDEASGIIPPTFIRYRFGLVLKKIDLSTVDLTNDEAQESLSPANRCRQIL